VGQAVLTIGSQLLLNDDLQQLSVAYPKTPSAKTTCTCTCANSCTPAPPRPATGPPTLT
jgi:hypothetical protein